jgi:hypothetical protein
MAGPDDTPKDRFTPSGAAQPRSAKPVSRLSLEAYRLELQGQVEWFEQVRAFVGGRIQMLKFTLNLKNLTHAQIEAGLRGLSLDGRGMVEALIAELARSSSLAIRVTTAVARFEAASTLMREIVAYLQDPGQSTVDMFRFMHAHDIAKVRGQLYGVTTFDALFRDDPVLNQIFPPIARSARLNAGPASRTDGLRAALPDSPNRSRLALGPPTGATGALRPHTTAKLTSPPPPPTHASKNPEPAGVGFLGSLIGRCQQILDEQTATG